MDQLLPSPIYIDRFIDGPCLNVIKRYKTFQLFIEGKILKGKKIFLGDVFILINIKMPTTRLGVNRNCLGQFSGVPWNQTLDVHRGSTLMK